MRPATLSLTIDRPLPGIHFRLVVDGWHPLIAMRQPGPDTRWEDLSKLGIHWLFVGQHLLHQAANEELANQVRESFQRISGLFGSKISVRWDQLSNVISSKVAGLGAAEPRTFSAISEGLGRSLEIRFDYRKSIKSAVEKRWTRPAESNLTKATLGMETDQAVAVEDKGVRSVNGVMLNGVSVLGFRLSLRRTSGRNAKFHKKPGFLYCHKKPGFLYWVFRSHRRSPGLFRSTPTSLSKSLSKETTVTFSRIDAAAR